MRAVHLGRLLVLERPVRVSDGAGGFAESWEPVGRLWAEISPGQGRDRMGEEVILSQVPYRIIVRGAPQGRARRPAPGQRFRDGGRVFCIQAVTERDPGGLYLTCFAREEIPT